MRRLFFLLALAPLAAPLTGCADLSRPEQITVVAEKPPAPPAPAPAAAAAAGAIRAAQQAAGESGAPQARAGGG